LLSHSLFLFTCPAPSSRATHFTLSIAHVIRAFRSLLAIYGSSRVGQPTQPWKWVEIEVCGPPISPSFGPQPVCPSVPRCFPVRRSGQQPIITPCTRAPPPTTRTPGAPSAGQHPGVETQPITTPGAHLCTLRRIC
jgi:hypothetical protein